MAEQSWNAGLYDAQHAFVSLYGQSLLEILAPQAGEHVLDLGCGTGHLASAIAETGATVVGLDSSPEMIATARQNYPNLEFRVGDARNFKFERGFDAVFSNAMLHWIIEADRVADAIANALKPNGRLVLEMGGKGNVGTIIKTTQAVLEEHFNIKAESGWYFPALGEYTGLLERHGLAVQWASLFERPTPLVGAHGLSDWLTMFGGRMLGNLPETVRQTALTEIENRLRPTLFRDGRWVADYVRLRVVARKI